MTANRIRYPYEDFVVCPDTGPRRLIRWTPPSYFPTSDIVAMWSVEDNVLRINHELFSMLPPSEQSRVMKTRSYVEYVNVERPTFNI